MSEEGKKEGCGHDCWLCRRNRFAESEVSGCTETFLPMYNKAVARRLYDESYYDPTCFMWKNPTDLIDKLDIFIDHQVILLGTSGDIRTGTIIAPYSEPTDYPILSKKNVWIRYSRWPEKVLVYPLKAITAFIDMDTYWIKNLTHQYRVNTNDKGDYKIIEWPLPF